MYKHAPPIVIAALFACVSPCHCDDAPALAFDGNRAKGFIRHLAADSFLGRKSATPAYRRAADWCAAQFTAWGLEPAGENGTYFQEVTTRSFDWNLGVPALNVKGRDFFIDDEDFWVNSFSTPKTTVKGDVVFVGYGIAAPAKGLDEYKAVNVTGAIVLAFRGSPADAPPQRAMLGGRAQEKKETKEEWKEESTDGAKARAAYDRGAVGILLYRREPSGGRTGRRRSFSQRPETGDFTPQRPFLCFTVSERVVRAIMKKDPQESPRGLGRRLDQLLRAIKATTAQSRKTGIRAVMKGYDTTVTYSDDNKNNKARNVLATIEGTDEKLKHQIVQVGGHLDHIGVRNGYVYNGADDNASGSSVVLEIARVLGTSGFAPKRTLLFCLWAAEEQGLLGSKHYVNHPCDGVTMDTVAASFNLDMVGLGTEVSASGALNFPSIWEVIKRNQDPAIMKKIAPSVGGPGGSDHTPFIERGIQTIFLITRGGRGHPDYHQPEDDAEKIDPEMLRTAGQFTLQGMVNLANETTVNLLIENRRDLYRGLRVRIPNLNPDLKDSEWSSVTIDAKSPTALYDQIIERTREIIRAKRSSSARRETERSGQNRPAPSGSKSIKRGLADYRVVSEDKRLLLLASEFYGFGRVDIKGDDTTWVVAGSLTDKGREAVRTLQENDIAIRLVSPPETLLNDMLSAASKPFIVTGTYTIREPLVDRINARTVLLGIDLDPTKPMEFVARAEELKSLLGERKNLFAFLTAAKPEQRVTQQIYVALAAKGWAHNEITGGRDRTGGLFTPDFSILRGERR